MRIKIIALCLLMATPTIAVDTQAPPVKPEIASGFWQSGGFSGSFTAPAASGTNFMLLETADKILLETGDKMLNEN